ncbi:MAG: hypothetical protein KA319_02220 [Ferruginibacter sp.]|nr:hypothetical protein [Ferruginibacter sp.]
MISAYGDTANGFLAKQNYGASNFEFVFYDSSGNIVNVKSNTWKGLGVYTKKGVHHFLKVKQEGLFGKTIFFIERVLDGKISVFKNQKEVEFDSYFFNNNIMYLPKKDYEYYLKKEDGEYILLNLGLLGNTKSILKKLFKDCEKVKKKVKGLINEEHAFNLILEYNNTCN